MGNQSSVPTRVRAILGLVILAAGCTWPGQTPECASEQLVTILESPAAFALVPLALDDPGYAGPVTFRWSIPAECNPRTLSLAIGTDESTSGAVWYLSGESRSFTLEPGFVPLGQRPVYLTAGHAYYWTVRSWSHGDFRASPRRLTVGDVCEGPGPYPTPVYTRMYPAGGSVVSIPVGLGWEETSDCYPSYYRLEVSTSPDFARSRTSIEDVRGSSGEPQLITRWTPTAALRPGTPYWWRIQGMYPGGAPGEFSVGLLFFTGPRCDDSTLPAPLLSSPANGQVLDSLLPTFHWVNLAGCLPEHYRIEVSTDPAFGPETMVDRTGPDTTLSLISPLASATQYWWRVTPLVSGLSGRHSPIFTFFTGPVCDAAGLVAPSLLSPVSGEMIPDPRSTLRWAHPASCIPLSYRVDLSRDPSFATGNVGGYTDDPTTVWAARLRDCQAYYWRVQPIVASGAGPFSETRSFFTNASAPVACSPEADLLGIGTPTLPTPPGPALPPIGPGTPAMEPVSLTLTGDANCRQGPGTTYPIVISLAQGDNLSAEGRNAESTWWYALLNSASHCWVSEAVVELTGGDPSLLPIIAALPLPATPTPTPTRTPTPVVSVPNAPTNLTVVSAVCSASSYSITLSWTDNAKNEAGYRVYRNGILIATLAANSTGYTDSLPCCGPTNFAVEAYNSAGSSKRAEITAPECVY